MTRTARKRPIKLRKIMLDPVKAGMLCAQVSPLARGQNPLQVAGWVDYRRRLRRVKAEYDGGLTVTFSVTPDFHATRIRAVYKFKGYVRPARSSAVGAA